MSLQSSAGPRPDELFQWIEWIGKAVTIASASCLGTAFVYDSLRLFVIDRRLLGYYAFADHLETAIFVMPWLLAAASPFLFLTVRGRHSKGSLRTLGVAIMLCLLGALLLFAVGMFSWLNLGTLAVATAIGIAGVFARRFVSPLEGRLGLGLLVLAAWLALTVLFAVREGILIRNLDRLSRADRDRWFSDAVTLKEGRAVQGHVIGLLSGGVILQTPDPLRYRWFWKDNVLQVETSTESYVDR